MAHTAENQQRFLGQTSLDLEDLEGRDNREDKNVVEHLKYTSKIWHSPKKSWSRKTCGSLLYSENGKFSFPLIYILDLDEGEDDQSCLGTVNLVQEATWLLHLDGCSCL